MSDWIIRYILASRKAALKSDGLINFSRDTKLVRIEARQKPIINGYFEYSSSSVVSKNI